MEEKQVVDDAIKLIEYRIQTKEAFTPRKKLEKELETKNISNLRKKQ